MENKWVKTELGSVRILFIVATCGKLMLMVSFLHRKYSLELLVPAHSEQARVKPKRRESLIVSKLERNYVRA
jgi:hypothetical protein